MRIVHAVRSDGFAGVERYVARLARAQAAAGHRVVVIGGAPEAMASTVRTAGVLLIPAASTRDVARALVRYGPGADVLSTHMTAAEIAAAAAGRLRTLAPVIATRHFAGTRGSGPLAPLTAAVARGPVAGQIAISEYVAGRIDGAATVVYPGVESRPDASPAAARERVVLIAQRLEPEKSTGAGVRAFAASGLAGRGWRLEIAGDGSRRTRLERLAAELGIARAVRFRGAVCDVVDRMARVGMLLAPCAVEGLGLSVVEAMAAGLPIIAANAGGHRETVGSACHDLLYPPDNPNEAGAKLAFLAASPARRDEIAAAEQHVQRSRFTPQRQVRAIDRAYAKVTTG